MRRIRLEGDRREIAGNRAARIVHRSPSLFAYLDIDKISMGLLGAGQAKLSSVKITA